MRRYAIVAIIVLSGLAALTGCGTVPKKVNQDVEGLRSRVDTLEARVEGVESRQEAGHKAQKKRAHSAPKPGSKANTRDIQLALKNAGFYQGRIDGAKGPATKKAIVDFQKANGLSPDGKVGPRTWELLAKYSSSCEAPAGEKEKTK